MLYRMYFSNQVWTSNNIRNAKIANISETCDYNSNALVFGSVEKSTSSDYTVRVTRAAITNSISLNVSDLRDNAMSYCEDDHSLMPDSGDSEPTSVAPTETLTLRTVDPSLMPDSGDSEPTFAAPTETPTLSTVDPSLMPDSRVSEPTSVAPTETPTLRTTVENEDHRIVSLKCNIVKESNTTTIIYFFLDIR